MNWERSSLRNGSAGQCRAPYLGESDSALLSVSAADIGLQTFMTLPGVDKPVTLGMWAGWSAVSWPTIPPWLEGSRSACRRSSTARTSRVPLYVRTDGEGRFVVPALAEGSMIFTVDLPDRGHPIGPTRRPRPDRCRQENHLDIALKRAIRVRGIVLERGTKPADPGGGRDDRRRLSG